MHLKNKHRGSVFALERWHPETSFEEAAENAKQRASTVIPPNRQLITSATRQYGDKRSGMRIHFESSPVAASPDRMLQITGSRTAVTVESGSISDLRAPFAGSGGGGGATVVEGAGSAPASQAEDEGWNKYLPVVDAKEKRRTLQKEKEEDEKLERLRKDASLESAFSVQPPPPQESASRTRKSRDRRSVRDSRGGRSVSRSGGSRKPRASTSSRGGPFLEKNAEDEVDNEIQRAMEKAARRSKMSEDIYVPQHKGTDEAEDSVGRVTIHVTDPMDDLTGYLSDASHQGSLSDMISKEKRSSQRKLKIPTGTDPKTPHGSRMSFGGGRKSVTGEDDGRRASRSEVRRRNSMQQSMLVIEGTASRRQSMMPQKYGGDHNVIFDYLEANPMNPTGEKVNQSLLHLPSILDRHIRTPKHIVILGERWWARAFG